MKMTDDILAILWHIASISDERIYVRHKERYFVELFANKYGAKIYEQQSNTNKQFACHLTSKQAKPIIRKLYDLGFTGHNSEVRCYPKNFPKSELFIKTTAQLCGGADYWHHKDRRGNKKLSPRYRLWTNKLFLEAYAPLFCSIANVAPKTIQYMSNNKTAYINFASAKEIEKIFYIYYYGVSIEATTRLENVLYDKGKKTLD